MVTWGGTGGKDSLVLVGGVGKGRMENVATKGPPAPKRNDALVPLKSKEGTRTHPEKVFEVASVHRGCPVFATTTAVTPSPTHVTFVASPRVGGISKVMARGVDTLGQLTRAVGG